MENSDIYLRAMMALVARSTFPPDKLAEIVSAVGNAKTYETYNLFDGTRSQAEVAKATATDNGLLSRTVKRWVEEGVMIKVTDANVVKPVHVYSLPDRYIETAKKKTRGKPNGGRPDSAEA